MIEPKSSAPPDGSSIGRFDGAPDVVIVDAVRTPVGRLGGSLAASRPDDLLAHVLRALVDRTGINPGIIDDVYAGCANQAGEDNRNVARMSALLAGFPDSVPGVTVNRLCASGLEAVNQAAKAIVAGEGDVFIGSGVESMSRAPWVLPNTGDSIDRRTAKMYDTKLGWRMVNPNLNALGVSIGLGETAEIIADQMNISRKDQDAFALESHRRAVEAIRCGRFSDEIIPLGTVSSDGDSILFDTDEHPRYVRENGGIRLNTSIEKLASLKPVFREGGSVTAGNASGLNDGAAAVLLMSARKARELNITPMARWIGSASMGVDPRKMGLGPVPATNRLLKRLGLRLDEISLVELNEAFAAQALAVIRELGLDDSITNVNGGAIALGHPLGCSGARILTTLVHEMNRRSGPAGRPFYGLATLCVGVGQGVSTIIEKLGLGSAF